MKKVPHTLNEAQRQIQAIVSSDNLLKYLHNIRQFTHKLAIDKSWVGLYVQPKKHKAKVSVAKGEKVRTAVKEEYWKRDIVQRYGFWCGHFFGNSFLKI